METRESFLHCSCDYKLLWSRWKAAQRYLKKLEIELPFHVWVFIVQKHEHEFEKISALLMFTAASFTVATIWKQPQGPAIVNE